MKEPGEGCYWYAGYFWWFVCVRRNRVSERLRWRRALFRRCLYLLFWLAHCVTLFSLPPRTLTLCDNFCEMGKNHIDTLFKRLQCVEKVILYIIGDETIVSKNIHIITFGSMIWEFHSIPDTRLIPRFLILPIILNLNQKKRGAQRSTLSLIYPPGRKKTSLTSLFKTHAWR